MNAIPEIYESDIGGGFTGPAIRTGLGTINIYMQQCLCTHYATVLTGGQTIKCMKKTKCKDLHHKLKLMK